MCRHATRAIGALLLTFSSAALLAQEPSAASATHAKQSEADEYTRYELLAPDGASFKILYEVSTATPGAKVFFNPIRKGSVASDEAVYDAMTGEPLHFEVVSGADARKDALMADADADGSYIKIQLARAVPPEGRGRLLIVKTYKDAKSYYREGDAIVFNRGLGIKRNSVVLPPGYELVGCNVPSQVLPEADGRIAISFMNAGPGEAPLVVRAKLGAQTGPSAVPHAPTESRSWEAPFPGETDRQRLSETYTAHASYRLDGDELLFDRSLGRSRNAVVLPEGWYLTASAIPATVTQLPDGRIRLDFWNGRPDSVDVLLKAKRRNAPSAKPQ